MLLLHAVAIYSVTVIGPQLFYSGVVAAVGAALFSEDLRPLWPAAVGATGDGAVGHCARIFPSFTCHAAAGASVCVASHVASVGRAASTTPSPRGVGTAMYSSLPCPGPAVTAATAPPALPPPLRARLPWPVRPAFMAVPVSASRLCRRLRWSTAARTLRRKTRVRWRRGGRGGHNTLTGTRSGPQPCFRPHNRDGTLWCVPAPYPAQSPAHEINTRHPPHRLDHGVPAVEEEDNNEVGG